MRILGVKYLNNSNRGSFTFTNPASGKTTLVEINYLLSFDDGTTFNYSNMVGYILGEGSCAIRYYNNNYNFSSFTVEVSGTTVSFTGYDLTYNPSPILQFIVYEVEI